MRTKIAQLQSLAISALTDVPQSPAILQKEGVHAAQKSQVLKNAQITSVLSPKRGLKSQCSIALKSFSWTRKSLRFLGVRDGHRVTSQILQKSEMQSQAEGFLQELCNSGEQIWPGTKRCNCNCRCNHQTIKSPMLLVIVLMTSGHFHEHWQICREHCCEEVAQESRPSGDFTVNFHEHFSQHVSTPNMTGRGFHRIMEAIPARPW